MEYSALVTGLGLVTTVLFEISPALRGFFCSQYGGEPECYYPKSVRLVTDSM